MGVNRALTGNNTVNLIGIHVVDLGRSYGRRGLLRRDARAGLPFVESALAGNMCHHIVVVVVCDSRGLVPVERPARDHEGQRPLSAIQRG